MKWVMLLIVLATHDWANTNPVTSGNVKTFSQDVYHDNFVELLKEIGSLSEIQHLFFGDRIIDLNNVVHNIKNLNKDGNAVVSAVIEKLEDGNVLNALKHIIPQEGQIEKFANLLVNPNALNSIESLKNPDNDTGDKVKRNIRNNGFADSDLIGDIVDTSDNDINDSISVQNAIQWSTNPDKYLQESTSLLDRNTNEVSDQKENHKRFLVSVQNETKIDKTKFDSNRNDSKKSVFRNTKKTDIVIGDKCALCTSTRRNFDHDIQNYIKFQRQLFKKSGLEPKTKKNRQGTIVAKSYELNTQESESAEGKFDKTKEEDSYTRKIKSRESNTEELESVEAISNKIRPSIPKSNEQLIKITKSKVIKINKINPKASLTNILKLNKENITLKEINTTKAKPKSLKITDSKLGTRSFTNQPNLESHIAETNKTKQIKEKSKNPKLNDLNKEKSKSKVLKKNKIKLKTLKTNYSKQDESNPQEINTKKRIYKDKLKKVKSIGPKSYESNMGRESEEAKTMKHLNTQKSRDPTNLNVANIDVTKPSKLNTFKTKPKGPKLKDFTALGEDSKIYNDLIDKNRQRNLKTKDQIPKKAIKNVSLINHTNPKQYNLKEQGANDLTSKFQMSKGSNLVPMIDNQFDKETKKDFNVDNIREVRKMLLDHITNRISNINDHLAFLKKLKKYYNINPADHIVYEDEQINTNSNISSAIADDYQIPPSEDLEYINDGPVSSEKEYFHATSDKNPIFRTIRHRPVNNLSKNSDTNGFLRNINDSFPKNKNVSNELIPASTKYQKQNGNNSAESVTHFSNSHDDTTKDNIIKGVMVTDTQDDEVIEGIHRSDNKNGRLTFIKKFLVNLCLQASN